jgi:hypothetical protein
VIREVIEKVEEALEKMDRRKSERVGWSSSGLVEGADRLKISWSTRTPAPWRKRANPVSISSGGLTAREGEDDEAGFCVVWLPDPASDLCRCARWGELQS